MRNFLLSICCVLCTIRVVAQQTEFSKDFNILMASGRTETQVYNFLDKYKSTFEIAKYPTFNNAYFPKKYSWGSLAIKSLSPYFTIDKDGISPYNDVVVQFKTSSQYKQQVSELFHSAYMHDRLLSYVLLHRCNDNRFTAEIQSRVLSEKDPFAKAWAIELAVLTNGLDANTFFELLLRAHNHKILVDEDVFMRKDLAFLKGIALKKVCGDIDVMTVATNVLSCLTPAPEIDSALKQAFKHCTADDADARLSLIYAFSRLRTPDLLPILQDWVEKDYYKLQALRALARSSSSADHAWLLAQTKKGKRDFALLNTLLNSENTTLMIAGLSYLERFDGADMDSLHVYNDTNALRDDSLLPYIHRCAKRNHNPTVSRYLARMLFGRKDSLSVAILIKYLHEDDASINETAAQSLKGCYAAVLINMLPDLLKSKMNKVSGVTELAIEHNLNTQHHIFEDVLLSEVGYVTKYNALRYLSAFPLKRHARLFSDVLKNDTINRVELYYYAALGLSKLENGSAVPSIIARIRGVEQAQGLFAAKPLVFLLKELNDKSGNEFVKLFQERLLKKFEENND
jgi:hypothetical protein